ncbi:MAG: hypothetical protein R2763_13345 [Mycobacterium sp.]
MAVRAARGVPVGLVAPVVMVVSGVLPVGRVLWPVGMPVVVTAVMAGMRGLLVGVRWVAPVGTARWMPVMVVMVRPVVMVVPVVVGVLGVPAVWVAAVLRRGFPVRGGGPVRVGLVAVVGMGVTVLRPRV